MRKTAEKYLGTLFAGTLLLTCLFGPLNAHADLQSAEDELTDGIYTYELIDGGYTITKCDSTAITKEVPSMRNGYPVTAIGDNAFVSCSGITELIIPDSIKTIGDGAFAGCTSLKKITLPSKLTEIPANAFMGCSMLEEVEMPDSVDMIGNYAFFSCDALNTVELPESLTTLGAMAFAECGNIETIDTENCSNFVFEDGFLYSADKTSIYRVSAKLEGDIYIADGVKSIEPGAFSLCTGIENLFIPSSVTYIGEDAFGYCSALKKIDFSEGLDTIADIAFKFCTSLETADFPTSLTYIGEGAFYNCRGLTRAVIAEGVTDIGMGAFMSCTELKQVTIPESAVNIGDNAFGYTENAETGEYELLEDFSISAVSESAGAEYAKKNDIKFDGSDENLKTVAFAAIGVGLIILVAVFAVVMMSKGRKTAPKEVRRAKKAEQESEEDKNYKKIVDDK